MKKLALILLCGFVRIQAEPGFDVVSIRLRNVVERDLVAVLASLKF